MSESYDDIINLPHHVSDRHPQMPMIDRAAQFAPFAALTGYDTAVKETARLTSDRIELTEEEKLILDAQLRGAAETGETVCITYFVPDKKKAGGAHVDTVGQVKKIDRIEGSVLMSGGTSILVENIVNIVFVNRPF